MAQRSAAQRGNEQATDQEAIRPFRVNIPEEALSDLRRRIAATRWPDKETVNDQSQGVPLKTVQELARYWGTDYNWRKAEARLNSYPQFITRIDGLDIHFIHVRSKNPNALPLIMTHGWPGSVIELLDVIGPLTDPTSHGGRAEDSFDVVIPSIPGFGFSERPRETGWDPERIARAWVTLMKRLGYTRFVAQGGDWGAIISELMAKQATPELLGIHTNMASAVPADVSQSLHRGDPPPSGLSSEERHAYERLNDFFTKYIGYATEMGKRPQTLTGLADSPVGLAAWILDGHPPNELILLENDRTREEMLDNITLYWLTNTAISSARIYWENKHVFFDALNVSIPVAVSVFPREIYQPPRSWVARAYPKLIHYNQLDRGGHFAAWEEPQLFTEEVRAGFRSLRGQEKLRQAG